MPGMPGGRGAQFPGGFPGQQGGRGMGGPNQQLPPTFGMGAQGLPIGAIQGAGGMPNGMNYPAVAQAQAFGRGGGGRGQAGMQGMPQNVPGMRGPGGQGYGQGRGGPMQQGRPAQGGRGQNAAPQMPGQAMPTQEPAGASGINLQTLNSAPPAQQKQMLGEALYPKIHAHQPELAGKITGMLLEMDNSELLSL